MRGLGWGAGIDILIEFVLEGFAAGSLGEGVDILLEFMLGGSATGSLGAGVDSALGEGESIWPGGKSFLSARRVFIVDVRFFIRSLVKRVSRKI